MVTAVCDGNFAATIFERKIIMDKIWEVAAMKYNADSAFRRLIDAQWKSGQKTAAAIRATAAALGTK